MSDQRPVTSAASPNPAAPDAPSKEAEVSPTKPVRPTDEAVRLWLLDQTMQHLGRNAAALGLGTNVVMAALREEREQIVSRLRTLGNTFAEAEERQRLKGTVR